VCRLLHLQENDTSTVIECFDLPGTTDGEGNIIFNYDAFRNNWYGFSVLKDMDSSGSLTAGDIVWGPGTGIF
jgi:hypothetical protein